jgi:3-hydroxyisobutyrate dehydrogenase-like beta-hydroxyacid dehydrogenase
MSSIGMIGLGQIGLPIAQNLIAAGFDVVGYRRGDPSEFVSAGGVAAKSAREVAKSCKIILSCIPDDAALAEVVSGPEGLTSGPCEDRILVELSTLDAAKKAQQARALEAKGGRMLDCAVSGIPRMVQQKQGVIFISGDEADFNQAKSVLDAVSTKIFFMGAFGNALKTKLCANMLVALHIAASAEALAFGTKLGIDPGRLIAALKDGAGGSLQFTARAGIMAAGDWHAVKGSTAMLMKDVALIDARAGEIQCPIPLLEAAKEIYQAAIGDGYGEMDVASIYAVVAERAGLPVPGKAA